MNREAREGITFTRDPSHESNGDPYFDRGQYAEGNACPTCGAVVEQGSFRWNGTKEHRSGGHRECPACRRIHDQYYGGIVTLHGDFVAAHHREIRALIENTEAKEKGERPLQRIGEIREGPDDGQIEVRTTYEHLARRIGKAIESAYSGELSIDYAKDEKLARVDWHR